MKITLPDASVREYPGPRTVAQIAADIGPGLAKATLGGDVDGALVDASHEIHSDAAVRIITAKDPEGLEILRHSCAHLLAQAVKQLYPEAQVTIGPVIEDGFYYDFAYAPGFTEDDLERIQERMQTLAKTGAQVERIAMSRAEAIAYFRDAGEGYKAEIIEEISAEEALSIYRQGDFTDLCRGPHVPNIGMIRAFKLTKLAGAYWRGDSSNEMLQRIYGTAWGDKKSLEEYLTRIAEAEKRDHRRIGKTLDLFHFRRKRRAWCSGTAMAGRSIPSWSAMSVTSCPNTTTRKSIHRRCLTAACGSAPAIGTNSATTCSSSMLMTGITPLNR